MSVTAVAATAAATSLLARYKAVRQASQQLCRPLSPEDMMVQSCPDASPVKWHLAHTTWFFETFVLPADSPDQRAESQSNSYLFNSYYNAGGHRIPRAQRGLLTRPTVAEVYRYRAAVDDRLRDFVDQCDADVLRS